MAVAVQDKSSTQELMQLIVKSSKVTAQVMRSLELAQSGQKGEANAELEQARKLSVEAHNLQTSLIQSELRGEAAPPSLLAVHAQDHFMNSHLLLELAAVFLNQIEEIDDLKARIAKLEQVGE